VCMHLNPFAAAPRSVAAHRCQRGCNLLNVQYNLKRKVAGLPPVTREWFEARKAQLSAASSGSTQRVWFDPLTKRKFMSEQTYLAHVRSNKYQDLVKKSGEPAPAPVVMLKRLDEPAGGRARLTLGCPASSACMPPAARWPAAPGHGTASQHPRVP